MSTKPLDQSPHLTSEQLAQRWYCSKDRVYKMRLTGEGPDFICPAARRYLYPLAAVEEWEAKHHQKIQPRKRRRRTKLKLA